MNKKIKLALGLILFGMLALFLLRVTGYGISNFFNPLDADNYAIDEKLMKDLANYDFSTINFNAIDKIDIRTKSIIKIDMAEKFAIKTYDIDQHNLEVTNTGGTLSIINRNKAQINLNFFSFKQRNKKPEIVIYLPKNLKLKSLLIEATIFGDSKLENIQVDNLIIKTGILDLRAKNLLVANKFNIEAGITELALKNVQLHNIDFDLGMSDLKINGDLFGKNSIDTGMSSIKLNLARNATAYNIYKNSAFGKEKSHNNAKDSIMVNSGLSELNITYGNSYNYN